MRIPHHEGSKSSSYGEIPPLLANLLLTVTSAKIVRSPDVDIDKCIANSSFDMMKKDYFSNSQYFKYNKNILINTVVKIKGHFNTNNVKSLA